MSSFNKVFLFLLILNLANCKLIQVLQVFRHGARFPTTADYDGISQQEHWGELLPSGMRQHYNLGSQFRKEYIEEQNLLKPTFDHHEFYIRSTDSNRTIMSAQSQIMGMFPNGPELPELDAAYLLPPYKGSSNYLGGSEALPQFFQPIPIHIEPFDYSVLKAPCIGEMDLRNQDTKNMEAIISDFDVISKTMREKICGYFNVTSDCDTAQKIYRLFGVYISDVYQGKTVPLLTQEEFNQFELISSFRMYNQYAGQLYSKFDSKPFFNDVFKHLSNKIANPNSALKWVSYSAHDSNVIIYARTLNFSSAECLYEAFKQNITSSSQCKRQPEYASNILFELHQENSTLMGDEQYFIKVKYNGIYQTICGDTEKCSYTLFKQIVEDSLATQEEFDQVCKGIHQIQQYETFLQNVENIQSSSPPISTLNILQFIVIVALLAYILIIKRNKNQEQVQNIDTSRLIKA